MSFKMKNAGSTSESARTSPNESGGFEIWRDHAGVIVSLARNSSEAFTALAEIGGALGS
jgi:hypothetical protein